MQAAHDFLIAKGTVAIGDISNNDDSLSLKQLSPIAIHTFIECLGFAAPFADARFNYSLAVEEALFRKRYAAQIKYKNDTVDYIKKNPQNFIVSEITGFSNGFVDSKFFRATPLRAVNTSGQPVSINIVESRGQFGRS
ncbi:MAG: hypothetical protein EBS88_13225 [Betaproteobacteria bacterium]|nr:hypothetical protein [Betaproteobacteria bacterium]